MRNLSLEDTLAVVGGNGKEKSESTNEKIGEVITDTLDTIGENVDNVVEKIDDKINDTLDEHCKK